MWTFRLEVLIWSAAIAQHSSSLWYYWIVLTNSYFVSKDPCFEVCFALPIGDEDAFHFVISTRGEGLDGEGLLVFLSFCLCVSYVSLVEEAVFSLDRLPGESAPLGRCFLIRPGQ